VSPGPRLAPPVINPLWTTSSSHRQILVDLINDICVHASGALNKSLSQVSRRVEAVGPDGVAVRAYPGQVGTVECRAGEVGSAQVSVP